jgi:hypothetical protein
MFGNRVKWHMTTGRKKYYASDGWRKTNLIVAVFNFCLGLFYLPWAFIQPDGRYYAIGLFVMFFVVGLRFLYIYLMTRYVPVAESGSGWITIRYGTRNRRAFTAANRVKDIRIKNSDVRNIRNGLVSLMICTQDGYRYFIYGLPKGDRQDILQRLFSV